MVLIYCYGKITEDICIKLYTIVLAFHEDLEKSKGTKNCVDQAKKAGLDVIVTTGLDKTKDD